MDIGIVMNGYQSSYEWILEQLYMDIGVVMDGYWYLFLNYGLINYFDF